MIRLTRLNGDEFYLNAEQVQTIESTPDTHIVAVNGQSYLAREDARVVAEAIVAYQRRVRQPALHLVP